MESFVTFTLVLSHTLASISALLVTFTWTQVGEKNAVRQTSRVNVNLLFDGGSHNHHFIHSGWWQIRYICWILVSITQKSSVSDSSRRPVEAEISLPVGMRRGRDKRLQMCEEETMRLSLTVSGLIFFKRPGILLRLHIWSRPSEISMAPLFLCISLKPISVERDNRGCF